jgi:Integrase core domain
MENLMKLYLDPKNLGSLGGVRRFYREVQDHVANQEQAKRILEESDAYTVNKETRRKFRRNKIIVTNLCQQYQADLADVKKYKEQNKGVQYLLVVIDCFSRKVSVTPLKDKTGTQVLAGLKKAFSDLNEPERLQTDKGTEFKNRTVQDFLKEHSVRHFTSENDDIKCAMAERFIRTLKSRIWRLFRKRVSTQYIDQLQNIVASYNNSEHSAHNMAPNQVSQDNSLTVYNRLYGGETEVRKPKYVVGDHVRISKNKTKMEKGYEYRFSEEIYEITNVLAHPVPMYRIKDELGKPIKGKFYEPELSYVRNFATKEHQIDKVLQRRGKKVKVRWLGYGPEHDQWIDASCVTERPFT